MREHAIKSIGYQVDATRRRVVQVLGHFTLQPDLLQLGDAEAPLRLPRLVGGGAGGLLAPPGPRRRPHPAPLHAVP